MQITLRFRTDDARTVAYYLKRRYNAKPKAKLEDLAMVAIRREVASEAQKELDELKQKEVGVMRVLNKRIDKIPSDAVYVGRPSKWGNPFKMNDPLLPYGLSREGKRKAVIVEYREWILKQPDLLKVLPELKGKDLVCWCSPLPCHADVLLELANK